MYKVIHEHNIFVAATILCGKKTQIVSLRLLK